MTEATTKSTMEEYVTKARNDYYSGITKTMINGKTAYELKEKFLDDLQNNAFSGTNGEDTVEHIENFLKIVDPLVLPNVSYERLRLAVFPLSLTGEASKWLREEPQCSITTWGDLTIRFFGKCYPPSRTGRMAETKAKGDDEIALTNGKVFDLEKEYSNDDEWYEALEDVKLKDEALKNKAIMEGLINKDDESYDEAWKR
ncbi:hypothetical protein Tco_1483914 [Tanacetum coccineum]